MKNIWPHFDERVQIKTMTYHILSVRRATLTKIPVLVISSENRHHSNLLLCTAM
jgi:hypothetical protein